MPTRWERLVACAAVVQIAVRTETDHICDVFIPGSKALPAVDDFEAITKHVRKTRAIGWEVELTQLLDEGVVTPELVQASLESRRARAGAP